MYTCSLENSEVKARLLDVYIFLVIIIVNRVNAIITLYSALQVVVLQIAENTIMYVYLYTA